MAWQPDPRFDVPEDFAPATDNRTVEQRLASLEAMIGGLVATLAQTGADISAGIHRLEARVDRELHELEEALAQLRARVQQQK